MSTYFYEDPCEDCASADLCDGWEKRFCCTRCRYIFGDDTPCEDCDPMDIQKGADMKEMYEML